MDSDSSLFSSLIYLSTTLSRDNGILSSLLSSSLVSFVKKDIRIFWLCMFSSPGVFSSPCLTSCMFSSAVIFFSPWLSSCMLSSSGIFSSPWLSSCMLSSAVVFSSPWLSSYMFSSAVVFTSP